MNKKEKIAFWDQKGYVCFYALSDRMKEIPYEQLDYSDRPPEPDMKPETLVDYLKAIKEAVEKSERKEIEPVDALCHTENLLEEFNKREIAE